MGDRLRDDDDRERLARRVAPADAVADLVDVERLRDDQLDDVEVELRQRLLRDGGHHGHRKFHVFLLEELDHFEAVQLRHHQVEHEHGVVLRAQLVDRGAAVVRDVDGDVMAREQLLDQPPEGV